MTFVTTLLESLVFASDIFIVLFIAAMLSGLYRKELLMFFARYGLILGLAVALAATAGSLYYSEVLGYTPCKLCWYQRIVMYPQLVLFGIAALRKQRKVGLYTIPLCVMGMVFSAWHYVQQRFPSGICLPGSEVPCNVVYNYAYGYITIPVMALTGFLLLTLFSVLVMRRQGLNIH